MDQESVAGGYDVWQAPSKSMVQLANIQSGGDRHSRPLACESPKAKFRLAANQLHASSPCMQVGTSHVLRLGFQAGNARTQLLLCAQLPV